MGYTRNYPLELGFSQPHQRQKQGETPKEFHAPPGLILPLFSPDPVGSTAWNTQPTDENVNTLAWMQRDYYAGKYTIYVRILCNYRH